MQQNITVILKLAAVLLLSGRSSLRQTLESFKCIVDEHPVLVYYFSILRHRCWCWKNSFIINPQCFISNYACLIWMTNHKIKHNTSLSYVKWWLLECCIRANRIILYSNFCKASWFQTVLLECIYCNFIVAHSCWYVQTWCGVPTKYT